MNSGEKNSINCNLLPFSVHRALFMNRLAASLSTFKVAKMKHQIVNVNLTMKINMAGQNFVQICVNDSNINSKTGKSVGTNHIKRRDKSLINQISCVQHDQCVYYTIDKTFGLLIVISVYAYYTFSLSTSCKQ